MVEYSLISNRKVTKLSTRDSPMVHLSDGPLHSLRFKIFKITTAIIELITPPIAQTINNRAHWVYTRQEWEQRVDNSPKSIRVAVILVIHECFAMNTALLTDSS